MENIKKSIFIFFPDFPHPFINGEIHCYPLLKKFYNIAIFLLLFYQVHSNKVFKNPYYREFHNGNKKYYLCVLEPIALIIIWDYYIVSRYMVEVLGIQPEDAIKEFNEARGHTQEQFLTVVFVLNFS